MADNLIIWSKGSTYEVDIKNKVVYIIPRMLKEMFGKWNPDIKSYVVLVHGNVIHVSDSTVPSSLSLVIKYKGKAVEKFIELLMYVLRKHYKGGEVIRIPMSDKYAYKFAVYLARMSELQDISDL